MPFIRSLKHLHIYGLIGSFSILSRPAVSSLASIHPSFASSQFASASQASASRNSRPVPSCPSKRNLHRLFAQYTTCAVMAAPFSQPEPTSDVVTEQLERSSLDNRTYKVIRLPNKLEALLIHDPDTDKASAALDVNVGSFSDAKDMPGMAHAVEHLLFMGTEKFPKENEYQRYLTSFSGYSNAFTASTSTNYYFELAARANADGEILMNGTSAEEVHSPLHGALDRFAQFFVAPLFLEETLDRELRAVDSENKKNLQSDLWRLNQLSKSLANPNHPFCHFSTGNLQTLRDEPLARGVKIRDEFMKFHKEHYSANRMKLVVLGRESVDALQTWVEELFAPVKNKELPQNRWDGILPYTQSELLTQVFAKPVMDTRSLEIMFNYQDEEEMFETQPGRYLSHLIGHEAPGSILAYIKEKGWANGLSAGSNSLCPGSGIFTISVQLTPEGLVNYQEVLKSVFYYISILKESSPEKWRFDEVKEMAEVDFKFKQKSPAHRTTSGLSQVMQHPLPREWLLSGQSLLRTFDAAAIRNAIMCLSPDNFRITIVSQQQLSDNVQKEKWYGTEYTVEKIPESLHRALKAAAAATANERPKELFLPTMNEFIPARLEVEKRISKVPSKTPKLIRNDQAVRLWFKKDDHFWVPKANIQITLRSPVCALTPRNAVMSQLLVELIQDSLVEYSYDAEIAGLEYSLTSYSVGINIVLSGYNDKMHVLLEKVLITLRDLKISDRRFEIIKERVTRSYKNFEYTSPYQQVGQHTRNLVIERAWIAEQLLAELPNIASDDLRTFLPQILGQTYLEALVHGNVYREDALRLTEIAERILKPQQLPPNHWPVKRSLILPEGSNFLYQHTLKDPANVNHCIEYFISVGDVNDRNRFAKLRLLAQMTDEPAFNQLRTQEQLGYVVFSGYTNHMMTAGYRILIQSERTPEYLESRIESFLRTFRKDFANMSVEDIEAHKQSVVNKLTEKVKNLNQESNRYWGHITSERYHFDQLDEDVSHVRRLTKDEMLTFFDNFIDPSSARRAKISIHMLAQSKPEDFADTSSAEDKIVALESLLVQYLETKDLAHKLDMLKTRLNALNHPKVQQSEVIDALSAYIHLDLDLTSENASKILEEGKQILSEVLPSLGILPPPGTSEDMALQPTVKHSTLIDNVHHFKSGIALSPGAVPVRDISEYEDLESKL